MESDSYVDSNREEPNPFVQSFVQSLVQSLKPNERQLVQPHRRWQGAIVDEGEHIRLQEESPRAEQMTYLNPDLQNIMSRFLNEQAMQRQGRPMILLKRTS